MRLKVGCAQIPVRKVVQWLLRTHLTVVLWESGIPRDHPVPTDANRTVDAVSVAVLLDLFLALAMTLSIRCRRNQIRFRRALHRNLPGNFPGICPLQDHLNQLAAGAVRSLRLLLQHTVHRTGQCKTVQAGFGIGFFLLLLIGKQNTMQALMFLHGVPEMPEISLW